MKIIGIRKLDNQGRVVIPGGLRKMLNINIGDHMEIFTVGDLVYLKKFQECAVPKVKITKKNIKGKKDNDYLL